MATTTVIQKLGTTKTHVEVDTLDQSALSLRAATVSPDGLRASADYVLAAGDSTIETTVKVRINRDPKAHAGEGKTNYSIRLSSIAVKTDDVSGETLWDLPVSAIIAFDLPGIGIPDAADVMQMLMNVFSLTYPSVDGSFEPSTSHVSELAYTAPALYN